MARVNMVIAQVAAGKAAMVVLQCLRNELN